MSIQIIIPRAEGDWALAREVVNQYVESLGIDLSFQNLQHELAYMEVEYSAPQGSFILAVQASKPVGCVGVRRFEGDVCEMKRLYIAPDARGRGIGKRLAQEAISAARSLQYRTMLLDTLPDMNSAQSLYRQLGFREIPAYRYNPVEGTTYHQLAL